MAEETFPFAFTGADLTDAINIMPNEYGMMNQRNILPRKGIHTTAARIQFRNGNLTVLPQGERGTVGEGAKKATRHDKIIDVPHFSRTDTIRAVDVQDRVRFGTEHELEDMATAVDEALADIRHVHDITLEHQRVGAIKGLLTDGNGDTLYDWFDVFGVSKKTINLKLNVATTDVRSLCWDASRHIEDNAFGETTSGIEAIIPGDFLDDLVGHPNVEKFWMQHEQAMELAGTDPRAGFLFGGIMFREYRARAPLMDGTNTPFIAEGYGHAFPTGTRQTFQTIMAPADNMAAVNAASEQDITVTVEQLPHGKGVELASESNPLAICKQPRLLVEFVKE